MILTIDTSTRSASAALSDGERIVAGRSWHSSVNHTTELMPAVSQLLDTRDVRPHDLEAVAVALGPGGFSALRTGLSAAKGLAMAVRIPIIGISSLDLEAFPFRDSGLPVCALLEAGRGEAASALFTPDGNRVREDRITGPDELLEEISAMSFEMLRTNGWNGLTLFCGEGMPLLGAKHQGGLGGTGGALPYAAVGQSRGAGGTGPGEAGAWRYRQSGRLAAPLSADAEHRRSQAPRPPGAGVVPQPSRSEWDAPTVTLPLRERGFVMTADAALLLGCGSVGQSVARLLGRDRAFGRVIVADRCLERAAAAAELCNGKAEALRVDCSDGESLGRVLGDVSVGAEHRRAANRGSDSADSRRDGSRSFLHRFQ